MQGGSDSDMRVRAHSRMCATGLRLGCACNGSYLDVRVDLRLGYPREGSNSYKLLSSNSNMHVSAPTWICVRGLRLGCACETSVLDIYGRTLTRIRA